MHKEFKLPSDLKPADITRCYKKKSKTSRDKYKPASISIRSILPNT